MTTTWTAATTALAFAAGAVAGWAARPAPVLPPDPDPPAIRAARDERMVPLRVGNRVRIDAAGPLAGQTGRVTALDCGDSTDVRMVEVGGVGRRVRDADLTLLPE